MTMQIKLSLALIAAFAVVVAGLVAFSGLGGEDPADAAPPVAAGETRLVRDDSHVLGEPGSTGVTFVEFLDFECEGCLAAYPVVEQLRETYAGQVTFVARYFPMPGHYNAERAARAAEAAARQGQFETMYQLLYETQTQWAHQQEPLDDLFRSYADDLGLDLDEFDADYDDPGTMERIVADQADGAALGVQGTPTFFIDGRPVQPRSAQELQDALESALSE